jgi:hypothetical protein
VCFCKYKPENDKNAIINEVSTKSVIEQQLCKLFAALVFLFTISTFWLDFVGKLSKLPLV